MTLQIALVLSILGVAVALFVTERLRIDLVALLVLGSLALTGLVTPAEAVSGFSNPAVVTVWAVFVLGGGLYRTGIANIVGRYVLRLAGSGEVRLIFLIMLVAGGLSGFMNNVGVAALLLPVVMDIARRTKHPPSKLLMPLAFGSLLGGLTTLIGTPPNILVSDALYEYGLPPFQLFDFTPIGLVVMLAGITFMTLVGRHLLPTRDPTKDIVRPDQADLEKLYDLHERLFTVSLPPDSNLLGKTLVESQLGSDLGLNVVAIVRNSHTQLAPDPKTTLKPGDRLIVEGNRDRLAGQHGHPPLVIEKDSTMTKKLVSTQIELVAARILPQSKLLGQTLEQIGFRRRFGVNVLAIERMGATQRTGLHSTPLREGDTLLVQGSRPWLDLLATFPDFTLSRPEVTEVYQLHERLMVVRVPAGSTLVGKTLADSRLNDVFNLTVLGIIRQGATQLVPHSETELMAGDAILVEGPPDELAPLEHFPDLELERAAPPEFGELESEEIGLAEVLLSPHTTLVGKSLRQLHFREKYGLSVLAIWHEGQAFRSYLRDRPLHFGDALLVHGPRDKLHVLGSEPDFLILTGAVQEPPRLNKAPVALLIMAAVIAPVILGWLPIYISAVVGAALMVLTACLTMEEAYRFIEWKAVFLIAGMLPLGIALQTSGAADFLAGEMVSLVGGFGPRALIAGLFILTALAAQVMPTAAVAVLLAPIAMNTARDLGISPYALMMTVAMSASASFLSPVAHPANVLTMGPGGYRFADYIRVGVPLTLVVLVVVLLVLPLLWPLYP